MARRARRWSDTPLRLDVRDREKILANGKTRGGGSCAAATMSTMEADAPRDSIDHVLRSMTDDDNFRVVVATTTDTVRQAIAVQQVGGETAHHFANVLTGCILARETLAPHFRLQAVLSGASGGKLVVDTSPDGLTRGLVQRASAQQVVSVSAGSVLKVMRNMAHGQMGQSIVQTPASGSFADTLMAYLQESEQIVSVIALGTAWQDERLVHAGGYVVQLLPNAERGPLMVMTQRLEEMDPIEQLLCRYQGSAKTLLDEILFGLPYAQLDDRAVRHGCTCNQEAVLSSLASLSRETISEMIREDELLELKCDYCNTEYPVPTVHLRGLVESS